MRFTSEDKIWIVLAGFGGGDTIAELCRQEGITQSQYIPGRRSFWKLEHSSTS